MEFFSIAMAVVEGMRLILLVMMILMDETDVMETKEIKLKIFIWN